MIQTPWFVNIINNIILVLKLQITLKKLLYYTVNKTIYWNISKFNQKLNDINPLHKKIFIT
jgi:hypothetical protein